MICFINFITTFLSIITEILNQHQLVEKSKMAVDDNDYMSAFRRLQPYAHFGEIFVSAKTFLLEIDVRITGNKGSKIRENFCRLPSVE